jgi:hypothetical protein
MVKFHILQFLKTKWMMALFVLVFAISLLLETSAVVASTTTNAAAGATTSIHLVKYKDDGSTVLSEKTVEYEWMMQNLPVYGDGTTHYYHQGPVFEGDVWDPGETINLKDKGAVKGTDIKDLCDLAGGMNPGSEVVIHAIDGYEITLAYSNIYEPLDIQGPVVLCWYKGKDEQITENSGSGYPGNDAYSSALQVLFMANTTNSEGQHVFGNSDMKIALPQEKYQHFYDGLPSTNGLSGKWISELRIYPEGAPVGTDETNIHTGIANNSDGNHNLWIPIVLGVAGLSLVSLSVYLFVRKRSAI